MADFTSTTSGNLSAGSTWVGGVAPGNGAGDNIIVVSGHTVTVDQPWDLGASPPQSLSAAATGAATTGGSLALGTYKLFAVNVDANGKESAQSPEVSVTLSGSNNAITVTLPALPAGVSSRTVYMTATGGATGTELANTTGIGGTTATITAASAGGAYVNRRAVYVKAGGTLAGSNGATLTVRGDILLGNTSGSSTLQGWAGGGLTFDPSSAASPSNATYRLWFGDANSLQANYANLTTSGTSIANPFTLQTAAGGYAAARLAPGLIASGTASDPVKINASYVNATRLGDASNAAIAINPAGTSTVVITLDHWIFDTCGQVSWTATVTAGGGFNITNCTWKNGTYQLNASTNRPCPLLFQANTTPTGGTRTLSGCVFDQTPQTCAFGSTYSNNIFYKGFDKPTVNTTIWTAFSGNLVRWDFEGGGNLQACGPVTDTVWIGDTAPALITSGTATGSQTSTTLQDTSQTWTTNAYQAATASTATGTNPGNKGWLVLVTGGTGVGQARSIASNTSNTLTVSRAWDVTPDGTTTYGVYEGVANPHYIGQDVLPAGTDVTNSGNIFWLAGADNNGDCFLHADSGTSGSHCIYRYANNIVLPNLARDNTGTLITIGADPNGEFHLLHNSYFTGFQCAAVNEGVTTGMAGVIKDYKYNLPWCDPAVVYKTALGAAALLGPFKLCDGTHLPIASGGGASDIVLNTAGVSGADFNASYGILTAYADQTFAGSGLGYQVKTTIVMGTHDLDGTDPVFVDRWRDPCAWGTSLGQASTNKMTVLAGTLAAMMAANDRSGYDSRYSIAALRGYLRTGQRPTASAMRASGDGTDTSTADAAGNPWPGATPGFGAMALWSATSGITWEGGYGQVFTAGYDG